MAFYVIMFTGFLFACLDPSNGQNRQTHPLPIYSDSHKDTETLDKNKFTSQTSLISPTETLTVRNQWTQKEEQTIQATSTTTGYHIPSGQENNEDYNEKNQTQQTHQPQNTTHNQYLPSSSQNASDEHDYHFMTWNNTTNLEHMKQNQNYSDENNTSVHIPMTSESHHSSYDMNKFHGYKPLVAFKYVAAGKPVSTDNWDLGPFPKLQRGSPQLAGDERLIPPVARPLLQWHVGIYSKAFKPFMQICGGTLVTIKAVISAAHCFWSDLDGMLPASLFMVAAGKLYRPWGDDHDLYAQTSEISAVHLPTRFRGAITSFQDDIAVVLLATPFAHSPAVRPLCVLFDEDLEDTKLQKGNEGVVLGWGLTAENGPPAQTLQYLYMPYVPTEECVADSDPNFLKYITSDKICAGVTTGKALCRGDSGGGLVFFVQSSNERMPILLGVASTAPRNEHLCNTHARATFTRVLAHRIFLRTHIPDIEEACRKNYVTFSKKPLSPLFDNRSAVPQNDQPQTAQPATVQYICNCYCNDDSSKY